MTSSASIAFLQTFGVDLPELGPTTGTAQITGDEDTVSIRSIDIRFGKTKDLNGGVTGRIDRIDLLNDRKVSDLDLNVTVPNLSQSTEVRCAIARFHIETGVAKSRALLIATPRMTLSGAGGVDFGGEKLDITLSADPKSFVPTVFKKPVRIHGDFLDLDYSTGGATTGLLGGLFGTVGGLVAMPFIFAPVSAAGSLVHLLFQTGEESPCLTAETPSLR